MEEEKELNLVEILKNAPKGTMLYSPYCGECELDKVESDRIHVIATRGYYSFFKGGTVYKDCGECLLFPSKEDRDWSTFKIKKEGFKVGDHIKKPERTVRCAYCGREFVEPIPHRCKGNYRKRRLKWIKINIMEEEKRKQFNASEFISNKETPVETRDGRKVVIITTKRDHVYPVVGDVFYEGCNNCSVLVAWGLNGTFRSDGSSDEKDLFFSAKKKTRPMTKKELAYWLMEHPEEHREYKKVFDGVIYSRYSYLEKYQDEKCDDEIMIRSNGGEWKWPEVEVKDEGETKTKTEEKEVTAETKTEVEVKEKEEVTAVKLIPHKTRVKVEFDDHGYVILKIQSVKEEKDGSLITLEGDVDLKFFLPRGEKKAKNFTREIDYNSENDNQQYVMTRTFTILED